MSINFGYPNEEAIDKIGVLANHDKEFHHDVGWTRSVIRRIEQDAFGHGDPNPRTGAPSGFDRNQYDAQELSAWDWYESKVLDTDQWKKLVKDYKTDEHQVKPEGYHEDKQYVDHHEPIVKGTNVPYNGSNNPNHELRVSTDALKHFANQLDTVVKDDGSGMLRDARNKLQTVQMRPGGFAKAELLRQKIDGVNAADAGLRGDSMNLMLAVQEALLAVKSGLLKMANEYEKAEDFNHMTADQLKDSMGKAWGQISEIGDFGKADGTTSGGR